MGLGSGIRKKPIPDPGGKKAPDPESRIRIRNIDSGKKSVKVLVFCDCYLKYALLIVL